MKIKFIKRLGGSVSTHHGKTLLRSLPLVAAGLLACTLTARAADSPGVKFNSGVRYSQWAINSRLHDFYGNQKKFGFDYYDNNGSMTKAVTWNKLGSTSTISRTFDYVAGLVGKATLEAADFYEGFDWSKSWFYAAQGYATETPYSNSGMTLDNMNAAKMYLPILAGKLKSDAATTVANTAIAAVIKDMKTYNSTYSIGGSKSGLNSTNANDVQKTMFGGWFHKSTDYTDQMWCDGQYMGPALLAQIIKHNGKTNNISDNDWDIIAKQFSITWAQLYDSKTQLLYHGFAANPDDTNSSSWAGISKDKGIYHSASFWGRANAWYFLALVDILEAMPTDNSYYNTFKGYLTNLAAGIKKYQDSDTGCWYQVLDKTQSSLTGNYLEASCSSIFTAAYLKAIRLGLLDKATYESVAKKAYEGLVTQFMVYDNTDNSTVQLVHSCTSAGLGKGRAGDDNYYINGSSDAKYVTSADPNGKIDNKAMYYTEGKVLGGFIMAATEYERAYQNQDAKQILFARDLAPEYDFSSTSGSLDATAYGDGNVSYQWYTADNKAVEGATKATFTPTADGTYYCKATAGNTTIQTSAATVKAKSASSGEEETPTTGDVTVTFSGDDLKSYKSPMTDATKAVTLTTTTDTISGESKGDIKVAKNAAFSISVSEGKYIKSITYTIISSRKGALTFNPDDTQKVVSSDKLTYTYNYSDKTITSVTATNSANKGGIQVSSIKVTYASAGSDTPTTKQYTVTASVNPAEGGNMYIYNGDEVLTSGAEVESGTNVKFSVSPNTGYVVTGWTVNGVAQNTTGKELTVTVKEATTVVANVEQRFYVYCTTKNGGSSTCAIECNGKAVEHGATLPKGSKVTFTATPAQGYKFVKWINGENESEELGTSNPLVVESLSKDFNARAVFEDIDPTKDNVVYDFLKNVGTEVAGVENIKITEGKSIMFGTNFKPSETKYLTVGADGDGGFKAGDVITLKGYCPKATSGILIYADPTDAEPQFQSPAFSATEVTYTFTVQKDCDKLYFGRFGGSSTYVTGLTIVRPGTTGNKTRLTAAFAKNSDVIINKTENYTIDLPALTVMAGEEEMEANQYSVAYSSNDEDIASVADGKITVKTTGTATILATVTPKDADKYEGCTATYTITVKEQTPLNISVNDVNINVTDANYKQPIIKVYGDDDKLLTLGTDYTLSYTIDGTNVSVASDNTLKVAGEKYNWTEGSSTITVTATPTPSLGETFKAGTMTFLYNVVKGKLTPAFLASFTTTGEAIKIKKYDSKTNKNDKKFRVPLIYNGEDVSEYFEYTFKVTDAKGAEVSNKNNKKNGNEFTFRPDTEGSFTISVSAVPTTKDKDDYSEVYNEPAAISFMVDVKASYIRPVITFNPETVQMYTGTTEGAPDVIVTDGKDELAKTYSLKWISFTPSFVKVDEESGKLEAVNEGNGSVRVTVKGENLETMTAFLTVYVDDPAVYRAKDKDNNGEAVTYGNLKQMWNQDRTISVTLGGWMFPNDVTEGLSYDSGEGLQKKWKWADEAKQPKWKMSGFNRFVSGEGSKNARQEDGSNALVNTTMISTADFKTKKGEVRDRMFNVPCSGSYLVFNPATNGTVNVHIFQNGAFDSGVYRPQRRVFVMDEQGNFVQSTPEIENANGKPTGGLNTLSNYKWDINPNGASTAPNIEQVRSHFKNIPKDFDMTAEKFQNNVLESNLSADLVPNAAYDEKVEGSNGWCVLADSPVTYTFKVKAGKSYYLWNFGSKIGFYGFSFEEDATKPEIDEVEYDEAATNNQIVSTAAGHMAKVSINRKLKAGIWNTCVLPFSLNMHQVDALFGATYKTGSENGTQILYFDRVDANGKVWFVRHAYNTIVANKPFLIKPTKDVESINTADCADYPYVTIEAPKNNKPADWCSDGKYAWVSSYNKDMEINEGDGYIGGNTGSFIQYKGNTATMNGFRGYLKGLTAEAKAHALSTATSSNTEENGSTTFIEGLTIDSEGNIVPVATDGKVYNVGGQVVAKDIKSLNSLPSGVYVINGKKYVK